MISVMMMITMMTMMEMEGIRDDKRICLFSTSMHFQMMLKRMEIARIRDDKRERSTK